jgi:hypothetical protein
MMTKLFTLFLLLFSYTSFAQTEWKDFSGKQRAFFYQLTRNIENMNTQVFHLFEFTDSIPYINDTLADFPYVEKQIVADSSKLILHKSEFSRKNNGIISDIATHYASWELGLMLQFRESNKPKFAYLKEKITIFEDYVREKAPQSSIRILSDGSYTLSPSIQKYYAPNLSINEKIAAIKNSSFSLNDQLLIIRSIYYAQEKYINTRSKEIFELLGGETEHYKNFLVGAGDGNSYSELESVLRTKYSRALPDPKTYFKFDTETKLDKATKRQTLYCKTNPIKHINTIKNLQTKVHLDVWGYHPERQTTIVIQKGGNSYLLYGNSENRYLTPDSTFEKGSTYWRLIYELENIHIANLREMIYGKRGYDYHIADTEKEIQKSILYIKESEEKLNKMRYSPIAKPKVKKKKKQLKDKNLGYSDQAGKGHITGKITKDVKEKNKEQSRLVHLNTQLKEQKRLLKQLKADKEKAFTVLASYETQLDLMKKNVGDVFVEFEKDKNGNFLFNDGTIFNYLEQDFTFKPSNNTESFDIITVAFGEKVFSKTSEEVFVHINVTHPELDSKYTLYIESSKENKLSVSDSIQIMELFTALGTTDKPLNIEAIGGGIIGGKSQDYYRDSLAMVIIYSKEEEKLNTVYMYNVTIDDNINLNVRTYRQAMLPDQFTKKYGSYYTKAKSKNEQLNEIDFYTTYLAKKRLTLYIETLTGCANEWLIDSDYQSEVLNKLKKAKNKKYYSVTSLDNIKFPKK